MLNSLQDKFSDMLLLNKLKNFHQKNNQGFRECHVSHKEETHGEQIKKLPKFLRRNIAIEDIYSVEILNYLLKSNLTHCFVPITAICLYNFKITTTR